MILSPKNLKERQFNLPTPSPLPFILSPQIQRCQNSMENKIEDEDETFWIPNSLASFMGLKTNIKETNKHFGENGVRGPAPLLEK